ncbi:MAG: sugar transferase [Chloroflexi bacterium]|jgi:lipopolysaccharide/colanic/teichoic acid biosynthesis glycosyltransferase|nr:sugar transferase [Chloroflexota bacterium]
MLAKRTFDLITSVIGLIVFSPILLVTGLVILITLGRPILYSPQRAGRSNTLITVRKFRSMRIAEGPTSHHSGDDDPRVTTVGRWMRKFKIDELPQLWNVMKGDMSIVGPRPETPDYIKHYKPEQMVILELRPGITDFASIEFADLGSLLEGDDPDKLYFEKVWDKKMDLRMKYVRERSFGVDIKLIFLTFTAVLRKK